ncbi:uracil-DNA glycosylase [Buchnera aphidicola]|uniref:Uracil-DNA glycosylase n=1 Tax=Buchnera aphidicola (Stegophylla sp.) TaxID=2315800 RepID=A0A4D6YMR5_9GAMM|nr:uracil-DNA glycosylase [Buchnera aphidicola (Stegophylla sp.)]QCI26315.1 uracil-DNA glycosylase [Buchnera aphidicola (Stegophylla sp.)]
MNWKKIFICQKKILLDILLKVSKERLTKKIYPPRCDVFNAFYLTPFHKIKVVILGQDPYYQENQAHGLAFSVRPGCKLPGSLKNIYQELVSDLYIPKFDYGNGCLNYWAQQGILLLNTILTVESGHPRSHISLGWNNFTDSIIFYINKYLKNIIFVLWGKDAQKKTSIIDNRKHYILKSSHPSPLSAHLGFFGCGHFSKINRILLSQNDNPIIW